MTLSAGSSPEDNDTGNGDANAAGRALEPTGDASSHHGAGIAPFLAAADERMGAPIGPRPLYAKLLDYSAHAAMIAGLLGFAWTISDHVAKPTAATAPVKVAAVAPPPPPSDEAIELRRNNQKMAADISALRLSLEALRGSMHQEKTAEQVRALAANLDGLKANLSGIKTETSASLAQLSTKIDHLPHAETSTKVQQIADRLEHIERLEADRTTTASIPVAAVAKPVPVALPPVKQAVAKAEPMSDTRKASLDRAVLGTDAEAAKKPPVIAEWVVRDVYNGVAVVEGKRGPMEVVPGVTIPGAGTVRSIDRHGAGWTVTTSKGLIAFLAPPRGREQRGYYRTIPEDF